MSYSFDMRYGAIALLLAACGSTARQPAPQGGPVHGAVMDEAGRSVVGATVVVSGDSGFSLTTTTGPGGRFEFLDVPPGAARVEASASGCFPHAVRLTVKGREPVECLLRLERTRAISGTVEYEGEALEGVVLEATPKVGGGTETGVSDAKGKFVVGGLRRGPHRLAVRVPAALRLKDGSYLVGSTDHAIDVAADTKDVWIAVPAGSGLRVRGPAGSVELRGAGIPERRYPMPDEGPLTLRGIPPVPCEVVLYPLRGKQVVERVELIVGGMFDVAFPEGKD
jgi:hypothetical protein